jgi:hypothetical protein
VRGFTSLAERLPPAEVASRLNRFYSLASNTIFDYDGTLDKLVGDQVMAFFGAPLYTKDHPERAVEAALQIISGMSGLAQIEHLQVGAGIATGEAFVGNVGEGAVTDYTVLGGYRQCRGAFTGSRRVGRDTRHRRNLCSCRVPVSQCPPPRAGTQRQERTRTRQSDPSGR